MNVLFMQYYSRQNVCVKQITLILLNIKQFYVLCLTMVTMISFRLKVSC